MNKLEEVKNKLKDLNDKIHSIVESLITKFEASKLSCIDIAARRLSVSYKMVFNDSSLVGRIKGKDDIWFCFSAKSEYYSLAYSRFLAYFKGTIDYLALSNIFKIFQDEVEMLDSLKEVEAILIRKILQREEQEKEDNEKINELAQKILDYKIS